MTRLLALFLGIFLLKSVWTQDLNLQDEEGSESEQASDDFFSSDSDDFFSSDTEQEDFNECTKA